MTTKEIQKLIADMSVSDDDVFTEVKKYLNDKLYEHWDNNVSPIGVEGISTSLHTARPGIHSKTIEYIKLGCGD